MRTNIKKTVLATALVLLSGMAIAQTRSVQTLPPPPPADGPKSPGPNNRPPRPERGAEGLRALTTISGKIVAYQTNERYIYNSLTLQSGNQVTTVRFPEHLGQSLMKSAQKGDAITISGFSETTPENLKIFQFISAKTNNKTIADAPPSAPVQPTVAESKNYSGTINQFKKDQAGNINAMMLDNKILIDLPPHASAQLQPLLKNGEKINVSGIKDTPPAGVAVAENAPTIIHPQTITISGQTYLLR